MGRYIILLVVILALIGCSQDKGNDKNATTPPSSAGTTNVATDFSPGITIDFAKSKNSYVTDDILNILKESLQAINDKNKENFVKGFIPGKEQSNLFWVEGDKQYHFNEIATTQHEGDRINLAIYYQVKDNGAIEDSSMTYTFLKDKDNVWKIALID